MISKVNAAFGGRRKKTKLGWRLQSYLPLVLLSPFRTTVPPRINRHAIFAIAGNFNDTVYLFWHSTLTTLKTASRKPQFWGHSSAFCWMSRLIHKFLSTSFPPRKSFPHKSYFKLATNARLKLLMKIYYILIFSVEWFTHSLRFTAVGKR